MNPRIRNLLRYLFHCILGLVFFMEGLGLQLHAQNLHSKRFTIEDGLPSQNIYRVMQDQAGYIWICTNQGLARFDSNRFEVFTTKDGLPSNDVFNLTEDSRGRLWVHSFANFICYYSPIDRCFHRVDNPYPSTHARPIQGFVERSPDSLIVCIAFSAFDLSVSKRAIAKRDEIGTYILSQTHVTRSPGIFDIQREGRIHLKECYWDYEIPHSHGFYAFKWGEKKVAVLNDSTRTLDVLGPWKMTSIKLGTLGFSSNASPRISILSGSDQYLLLRGEGMQIVLDSSLNRRQELEVQGEMINSIFVDRDHNIWYGTQDGGVILVSAETLAGNVLMYGRNVKAITGNDKCVWMGTSAGELYRLEIGKRESEKVDLVHAKPGYARELMLTRDGLWGCYNEQIIYLPNHLLDRSKVVFQHTFMSPPEDKKSSYVFRRVPAHRSSPLKMGLIFPSWKTVSALKNGGVAIPDTGRFVNGALHLRQVFIGATGFNDWVYAIQEDELGRLWNGGGGGLSCRNADGEDLLASLRRRYTETHYSVLDIALDSSGNIWVGTDGYGLWCLEPNALLAGKVHGSAREFLRGTKVNHIFISERNEVWAATADGAFVLRKNGSEKFEIRRFTVEDGLPANAVNSIFWRSDTAYIATQLGLKVLPTKSPPPKIISPPLFVRARLAGELQISEGPIVLDYDQADQLSFDFTFLYYFGREIPTVFWYRFIKDGKVGNWQQTQDYSVEHPLLGPGEYRLEVQARIGEKVESEMVSRDFIVRPPWWRSTWFSGLVLAAFIAFVWLIFAIRFRYLRRRDIRKSLFAGLRLQALQAQMNPHFVSNILVAVQGLIAEDKGEEAREYLSRFSELNRKYLEASHHKWVSLNEELEMLQNYLELEKLRFGERFDFEIVVPDDLRSSVHRFPSRLLQPLAENAIHHGLAYLQRKGLLKIQVERIADGIIVVIDDDGIGRLASSRLNEKRKLAHISRGTALVQEIIHAINSEATMRFELMTIDKKDANGQALGTRVEVRLIKR